MSKEGSGKGYPFYLHESSSLAQNKNFGKYDLLQKNRERESRHCNNYDCSTNFGTEDRKEKYKDIRVKSCLRTRRIECPKSPTNIEHSIDELIQTNAQSEPSSSSIQTYANTLSDERSLRQRICDLYKNYLYAEEIPVKENTDTNCTCKKSSNKTQHESSSKFSLEEKIERFKFMKRITPTKFKYGGEEIQVYREMANSDEYIPHEPPRLYTLQLQQNIGQRTAEKQDICGLSLHPSHNESFENGCGKYLLQKPEGYISSTISEKADSFEEICVQVDKSSIKGIRWITSTMASTHYPSRWLGAMIRDFLIYLFFLICLSTVVLSSSDPALYYYCHSVYQLLLTTPYEVQVTESLITTKTYYQMNSIADQWSFIRTVFVPNVYVSQIIDMEVKSSNEGMEMYESVLIGVPRLQQARVKPDECQVLQEFKKTFDICFDYYSKYKEDTQPFGTKENNGWMYSKDPNDRIYFGKVSNYLGGGYSYKLSNNVDKAKDNLENLYQNTWIDRATRVVFIDFTLYTPNINYFHVIKLAMELPPSGGVLPSAHCYSLKLIKYISYYDFFILAIEIFLIVFVIYFTAQLIREFIFYGRTYILLLWGVYDILLLMMAYTYLVFWIYLTIVSYINTVKLINNSMDNSTYYPNFNYIAQLSVIFQNFSVIFLFAALIKILRFLSISKTYCYFSSTLSDCALQIISHVFLVTIVLLIFAAVGHLLFGSQVQEFSSIGWSFFTLFVMILGFFNYGKVIESNFIMAPIFIYIFTLIIIFLFVNFFIAILVQAYSSAGNSENETECSRLYIGEAISQYIKILADKKYQKNSDKKIYQHHSESNNDANRNNREMKCNATDCYFAHIDPFVISSSKTKTNHENLKYLPKQTRKVECEKANLSETKTALEVKDQDYNELEKISNRKSISELILIKNKIEGLDKTVDQLFKKINIISNQIVNEEIA